MDKGIKQIASFASDLEVQGNPGLEISSGHLAEAFWVEGHGLNWQAIFQAAEKVGVEYERTPRGGLAIRRKDQ